MFITESIRIPAESAAFLISSALWIFGSVGACTISKPASRASLKRSPRLSFSGNMSKTKPFVRESGGDNAKPLARDPIDEAWHAPPVKPAAHRVVTEDLRNSRREG